MFTHIKVGTRPSRLALKQVDEIQHRTPHIKFDVVIIKTKGDKDKARPLSLEENTDFFTYEIEKTLLNREIDTAVHSAKDLEEAAPKDLVIAAMTESISRFDCLVAHGGFTLDTLPSGSIVGTSSRNRKEGILTYRNDLTVLDIRGDIEERLAQLDTGYYDAIIVAHAALIRLGYEDRISQVIPLDIIQPHSLQGNLAVQVRRDRKDLIKIFRSVDEKGKR